MQPSDAQVEAACRARWGGTWDLWVQQGVTRVIDERATMRIWLAAAMAVPADADRK